MNLGKLLKIALAVATIAPEVVKAYKSVTAKSPPVTPPTPPTPTAPFVG